MSHFTFAFLRRYGMPLVSESTIATLPVPSWDSAQFGV